MQVFYVLVHNSRVRFAALTNSLLILVLQARSQPANSRNVM
jgi:hypothetical protein